MPKGLKRQKQTYKRTIEELIQLCKLKITVNYLHIWLKERVKQMF